MVSEPTLAVSRARIYALDKLLDVSGPNLGEAGRYRMISEPTLAVSRARTSVSAEA